MRRLATLASLIVFLAGLACLWAWQTATDPVVLAEPVFVEIPKGAGSRAIAKELAQRGIVRDANLLLVLARLHGKDRTIRYGGHRFEGSMTMEDVLTELARVPKPTLKLTVPEGLTWAEIGAALEAEKLTTAEDWKEAVCSAPFLERSGAPPDGNCAEGFLFPDTYHLEPGMSAEAIAALLLARFEEVWSELHAAHEIPAALADGEADARTLRNRVVTLASIVEKETGAAAERRRIAGVFDNRLRRRMLLQTDPTVIYGLLAEGEPWDGNLRREHLRRPTRFNTYVHAGLPPGPICNPGREALAAALDPEPGEFLYFVARGDGTHEFTRSLADHNRAVRRWQLGRP
jgi:UPF0755 protein